MNFIMQPVGQVMGGRQATIDDDWGESVAVIELDKERFEPSALSGLESFSHVEVLFVFDQVRSEDIVSGARHPRGNLNWPKIGIFAQRGKNRPNRIGVTICKIRSVSGLKLEVQGLDAVDGTPVLDIKPLIKGFGPREEVREPSWAVEIMSGYW